MSTRGESSSTERRLDEVGIEESQEGDREDDGIDLLISRLIPNERPRKLEVLTSVF
jgi:hypothetical protein